MAAPVKILVAGLPAEIVREVGLRLRGVAITEFDNAQKMGRAAAHGEARAIILSDALPTEEAIYVARRARDTSDEMHIAFCISMEHAENALRALRDIQVDRFFLAPVDMEEMLRELGKACRVEVLAPQETHAEHIAAAVFEAWDRARPSAFMMIDKLNDAAIALLENNPSPELKAAGETVAAQIAELAGKFGFKNGARLARDIAERFGGTLSAADGVWISEHLLALRENLVGSPSVPATSKSTSPGPAEHLGEGEESRLRGRRIVVVDDEPIVSRNLVSLLGKRGLAVTAINDPLRFWTIIEETKPNLILLDLEMPKISGAELCRVIRNDRRWSEIPVIFLTGHTDQASVHRIFTAGADDYVGKPFVPAELMMRIESRLTGIKARKPLVETDPLTGLATSAKATELIDRFLRLARRKADPYSIAVLQVDGFGALGSTYGRALSNFVLRGIGQLLPKVFRAEDVPGWWGGADFTIGMYGSSKEFAAMKLAQICAKVAELNFLAEDGRRVRISCSAGVAQYQIDGDAVAALRDEAFKALEQARASGGGVRVGISGVRER
jgi:diguanylate cyclase (GGDEF)-like protein